jgi:hypothetical protein
VPAPGPPGMLHSGPWMRGNTKNSAIAIGAAKTSMRAAIARRVRSGGTAPVNWNDSWVASSSSTDAIIMTAVPMPCA